MARLRGELDLIGIDTLFQALTSRGIEGYLEVSRDAQRIVLALSSAGIRVVRGIRRVRPLGEILVQAGKITQQQLESMLAEQRTTSTPLGELVVQRGILPRAMIDGALRKQVAEEIHELFTWTGAMFQFHPATYEPPPDEGPRSSIVVDGNIVAIMLEAARRTDELQQIRLLISDDRLIPILTELPGILEDPGLERPAVEEVVPLVDGKRSVQDILEVSLHPKYTVLRTLYGLVVSQVLKIQDKGRAEGPATVLGRPRNRDSGTRTQKKLLVLSDGTTFGAGMALWLRSSGFAVFEEKTSVDIAEAIDRTSALAVVAEVPLDSAEGQDICRRLKETSRIPYIVVTGNAGPHLVVPALNSGARFVLTKPLDERRLVERINELLTERDAGVSDVLPGAGLLG
jgi:CheY-like chemotaxis protein